MSWLLITMLVVGGLVGFLLLLVALTLISGLIPYPFFSKHPEFKPRDGRVVFYKHYLGHETWVVEYKPQCRTVVVGGHSYYLSFPYMQFYYVNSFIISPYLPFRLASSLAVTMSNEPIVDENSTIYPVPLPNINPRVCGILNTPQNLLRYNTPEKAVDIFWNSTFNGSGEGVVYLKRSTIKSYPDWEKRSHEDPSFITKIQWIIKEDYLRSFVKAMKAQSTRFFSVLFLALLPLTGCGSPAKNMEEDYRSFDRTEGQFIPTFNYGDVVCPKGQSEPRRIGIVIYRVPDPIRNYASKWLWKYTVMHGEVRQDYHQAELELVEKFDWGIVAPPKPQELILPEITDDIPIGVK